MDKINEYILPFDEVRVYIVIDENDAFWIGQFLEYRHEKPNWQNTRGFSKAQEDWFFITEEQAKKVDCWRSQRLYGL